MSNNKETKPAQSKSQLKKILLISILTILIITAFLVFICPMNISINGDDKVTVAYGSEYQDAGASSRLNIGAVETEGSVDTSKCGTYYITYRWFFVTRSRQVEVVDLTPPQLTVNETAIATYWQNHAYVDAGYTAVDDVDGDISSKVTVTGFDSSRLGSQTVTYTVTDSAGNTSSFEREVAVVEDQKQYCTNVTNTAKVSQTVIDLIKNYYNQQYYAMANQTEADFAGLFDSASADQLYLHTKAVSYYNYAAGQSTIDLKMSQLSYSFIVSKDTTLEDGNHTIVCYEDIIINYNGIAALTTNLYTLQTDFTYTQASGGLKLVKVTRHQDFDLMFTEHYTATADYKTAIDTIYNNDVTAFDKRIASQNTYRQAAIDKTDTITKTAPNSYDRQAATAYAASYVKARNKSYMNSWSSNCQNFVSQCLHAGGIPYDYSGAVTYQWKYYSGSYNADQTAKGYVYSWTAVNYFYRYAAGNTGAGLVSQITDNIYLAQGGDVIQVSQRKSKNDHATLVYDLVTDQDGNTIDLLLASNTNNYINVPLSTIVYPYVHLIAVVGYN